MGPMRDWYQRTKSLPALCYRRKRIVPSPRRSSLRIMRLSLTRNVNRIRLTHLLSPKSRYANVGHASRLLRSRCGRGWHRIGRCPSHAEPFPRHRWTLRLLQSDTQSDHCSPCLVTRARRPGFDDWAGDSVDTPSLQNSLNDRNTSSRLCLH